MRLMVAALVALSLTAFPDATVSAAYADFYAMRAQGQECRYLWAKQEQVATAKFVVVLASREPLLDYTVPQVIGGGLLRLNLTALRWSVADWSKVCGAPANPYTANVDQLIVPAGFFIDRISDGRLDDGYYRLYFGGQNIPRDSVQFLKQLGVDSRQQRGLSFGLVEGASGVNVARNGARLIAHEDGIFSEAWITRDTKTVAPGSDPLEALDAGFKFDGSEIFALTPKVATTGTRGLFPVTALVNGAGKIVAEAPVDLVRDHTEFKGQSAIVNPGSCIQCHANGSQRTTVNALRDRLSKGIELLTYDRKRQVEIELFHLGSVDEAFDRWDKGYAAALAFVNGMTPQANAAAFQAVVSAYHADVTVATAAADLFCTPAELRLSLGYASAHRLYLSNRLAGLAHDVPLPRTSWEAEYLRANELLCICRKANQ